MACRDPDYEEQAAAEAATRMKGLTIALCIACDKLDSLHKLPKVLRYWHAAHVASDNARKCVESAQTALNKAEAEMERKGGTLTHSHPAKRHYDRMSELQNIAYTNERAEALKLASLKVAP